MTRSYLRSPLRLPLRALCAASLGVALNAWSQTPPPPDAGRLLNEAQRREAPRPAVTNPLGLPPETRAPLQESKAQVLVKGFTFTRNLGVASADLAQALTDYTGKNLSFADIMAASDRITALYRSRGYSLARAYVPQQDMSQGQVEITVLEGTLEAVRSPLNAAGSTPGGQRRGQYLPQAGGVVDAAIVRSLLLLNELPGTQTRGRLSVGQAIGGTVLDIDVQDTPAFSLDAALDNEGGRTTGRLRASGGGTWNSPSGAGDQLSLRVMASSGLHYLRAGYTTPLGTDGLKAQIYALGLGYQLGGSFGVLEAKGSAKELGVGASYALERSGAASQDISATLSSKQLANQTIAGKTSDKTINAATLGWETLSRFAGEVAQSELSSQVSLSMGRLDLSRLPTDAAADALGPKAQGRFTKLRASAQWRAQPLANWRSTLSVQTQAANTNLDSGEQFSLGGATAVRGYASGEGSGDAGWVATVQLTRNLSDAWSLFAGLDHGRAHLHKRPWTNWQGNRPDLANRYALSSAALGAQWRIPGWSATLTLAKPTGGNPGADAAGRNSDGSGTGVRASALLSWVM